ncbi:Uncharacterised protein [Salmonella enterica subsp. enterica serovar Bovismorbificans]|uniref:Uncharacterized protein n=1 Tax=Salmonella enterica subsp. enterica serovar Bovismorbificans TaxID=58097 RepID=A0A655EIX7_SALET|nr:Uncharacterised protein [Salmonella enterica subsp. enterica serovar Bovismorbificans]
MTNFFEYFTHFICCIFPFGERQGLRLGGEGCDMLFRHSILLMLKEILQRFDFVLVAIPVVVAGIFRRAHQQIDTLIHQRNIIKLA